MREDLVLQPVTCMHNATLVVSVHVVLKSMALHVLNASRQGEIISSVSAWQQVSGENSLQGIVQHSMLFS